MQEVREKLEELSKKADSLSEEEKGFVRARSSYLTDKLKKVFAEVLKAAKEVKAKKGKKK